MSGKRIALFIFSLLMCICFMLAIVSCDFSNKPDDTCKHTWQDATCTAPKTCSICGETEGDKLGHTWVDANCTAPKTCSVCHVTEGAAKGHTFADATCTAPKTCTVCQATEGAAKGHTFADATCTAPKTCTVCQATEGAAKGHTFADATCTAPKTCTVCQATEGAAKGHTFADATCTAPKTCTVCQATEGAALGHTGGEATCQSQALCSRCNLPYGELGEHDYDLTAWGYKGVDGHAHVCKTEGCDAHDTVIAHISGGAATETADEICTECSYIIAPALGHITHIPADEWSKDETGHWHACVGCDEQKFDEAEHEYDNNCDADCNICGYVREINHIFTKNNNDAENHWVECEICGEIDATTLEAHRGGTASCGEKAECEVCDSRYGELDSTNHESDEFTYSANGDGTHQKMHACCGATENAAEACEGGEATCSKQAKCEHCGARYGELDSTNHTGEIVYTSNKNGTHKTSYDCCGMVIAEAEGCEGGEATCSEKAKCEHCGGEHGETTDHTGGTATCQAKAVCTVCHQSYGELGGHSFDLTIWGYKDANGHAHLCSVAGCHEHDTVVAHTSSGAATETEAEICTDCDYVINAALGHTQHTAKDEWQKDAYYHWHGCTGCEDVQLDKTVHEYSTLCDTTCDTCGYVRAAVHTYSVLRSDETHHWYECAICHTTKPDSREAHKGGTATCTDNALCEVCGEAYGKHDSTNHTSNTLEYYSNGDGTHLTIHACCGGTVDEAEDCHGGKATCQSLAVCEFCKQEYGKLDGSNHTSNEFDYDSHHDGTHIKKYDCCGGIADANEACIGGTATCTDKAICTLCGGEHGELLEHTPVKGWTSDESGHWHICSACGGEQLGRADHNYDNNCDITCNTCGYVREITHSYTVTGKDSHDHWYACSVCGVIDPASVEAHKGGTATCTDKALCSDCGENYGEFDGTNHKNDKTVYVANNDGTHTVKHDCCGAVISVEACGGGTANCQQKATCQHCAAQYGEIGSHVGGNATCEHESVCDICGESYGGFGKHVFSIEKADAVYIATPATCDYPATYYKTCACGTAGEETFVSGSALGHSYGEWTTVDGVHTRICKNDPTHVETGDCSGGKATCEAPAICSVCGHEYGKASGHAYGEWVVTQPAGCLTVGKLTSTCTNPGCTSFKTEDIPATGHDYTEVKTEPTCREQGYITHICDCGDSYIDSFVDAVDHEWDIEAPTCDKGQTCLVCGETTDALGHNYEISGTTEVSCSAAASITYTCENCNDSYTDTIGTPKEHNINGVTPTLVAVADEACKYVQHYICLDCGSDVVGKTVYNHENYTAKIVTPATCTTEGQKKLTCTACGYEKPETEAIPVDKITGHSWDLGSTVDGVTTYKCTLCSDTKSVVTLAKDEKVNAESIKNTELKLENGANITLGDAADAIGNKDVTVSVNTVDKSTLNLTPEQQSQIGGNQVYDFSIMDGDQLISDFGKEKYATVSLPYTLKSGDNVDSIAVWYINDKGELTSIEATYNNGYVTFKTDHFSYYTVTELTPKERCQLYGHNYSTLTVEADCTQDGYTLKYCIRCGHSEKTAGDSAIGHNYVIDAESSKTATCTTAGRTTYECTNCGHTYKVVVPALKHNWIESENVAATCMAAGHITYSCTNEGCGASYTREVAKLTHSIEHTKIDAGCDSIGYTLHYCANEDCTYSYTTDVVQPTGHEYSYSFTWNEDNTSVTLKVNCAYGCGLDDSVTSDRVSVKDIPADCYNYGHYEYTVRITYNGEILEDVKTVDHENPSYNHSYSNAWRYDDGKHWHECDKCGAVEDASATEHKFGEGTVTKKATCSETGIMSYACECGYIKIEIIPKTTEHKTAEGEYKTDEKSHWSVCYLCGTRIDAKEHSFELVSSKAPTCAEAGESLHKCSVCGYEHTEKLAATGEHTYVDGKCSVCGHIDGSCTHKLTVEDVLDISEYGMCVTKLDIIRCECGQHKQLADYYQLVMGGCEWDESSDRLESGTDENGREWMSQTMDCNICGAHMYVYAFVNSYENCVLSITYEFTITMGDVTVLDKVVGIDEQESHMHTVMDKVSLGENSACGSYYEVQRCADCSKIVYIQNKYINCIATEGSETIEKVIDENGVEHVIITMPCSKCGLVYVTDTVTTIVSECEYRENIILVVYENGVEIFRDEDNIGYSSHEFEFTYVMDGATCDEGYLVTQHCPKCGITSEYRETGHVSEWREIELSEFGTCGGYISCEYCAVCESITRTYDFNLKCDFSNSTKTTVMDESGVAHEISISTCTRCGLEMRQDNWNAIEGCTTKAYSVTTLVTNGETLVEFGDEWIVENRHNYVETIDPKGDDCEKYGYVITRTCTVCGVNESYFSIYHHVEEVEVDVSEYGACGGILTCNKCLICGKITSIQSFEPACNIDVSTEPPITEYVDEKGIVHRLQTVICPDCGLTVMSDSWEIDEGDCYIVGNMVMTITVGDTEIVRAEESYGGTRHDMVNEIKKLGDTCDDGYTEIGYCTKCGLVEETPIYYGHRYEYEHIELGEYTSCGGYAYSYVCDICGTRDIKETYIDLYCGVNIYDAPMTEIMDEYGNVHYVRSVTCPACGLIYTFETWSQPDGSCIVKNYTKWLVEINGEVIIDWSDCVTVSNHNYQTSVKMHGATCEDGYDIVYTCTECKESYTEGVFYGCSIEEVVYDLSEYGVECGGRAYIYKCLGCGRHEMAKFDYYCRFDYMDMVLTEDGYEQYTCLECGAQRRTKITAGEKDENCVLYETYEEIFVVNGEAVWEYTYAVSNIWHRYEVSNVHLSGKSCMEGVTITFTCVDCGDSYSSYTTDHYMLVAEEINKVEYGICDYHNFRIMKCTCGEKIYVDHGYDDRYDVDYKCDNCPYRLVISNERVTDGCAVIRNVYTTAYAGETELLSVRYADTVYRHNIEIVKEILEDGCEAISTVCINCGLTSTVAPELVQMEFEPEKGIYYGDVVFVPEQSGEYIIHSISNWDTYVTLYRLENGEYIEVKCDDDAGGNGNFKLSSYLEAGYTYVYRIRYYDNTDHGSIQYVLSEAFDNGECDHQRIFTEYVLAMGSLTCEDGVIRVDYCPDCGFILSTNTEYGHISGSKLYDFSDFGACYGELYLGYCACGEDSYIKYHEGCYEEYTEDLAVDENGVEHWIRTYTCNSCGKVVVIDSYYVEEGCYDTRYVKVDVMMNGELVISELGIEYRREHHSYEYVFNFDDAEGEQSCENGVTVIYRCSDCGIYSEYHTYKHETFSLVNMDLYEYGACGGRIEITSCACGEERHVYSNFNCQFEGTTETYVDELGRSHTLTTETCRNCGFAKIVDSYREKIGCQRIEYIVDTFEIGDTVLVDGVLSKYVFDAHQYEYIYVFDDAEGEKNCENGVTVTQICANCDYTSDYGHIEYHEELPHRYDLTEYGACGGYIEYHECACGYESSYIYFDHEGCLMQHVDGKFYEDEFGVQHDVNVEACAVCGLTRTTDNYCAKENCFVSYTDSYTVTIGDVVILSDHKCVYDRYEEHDYNVTYEFTGGEQDCESGVRYIYTCDDCGYSYSNDYSWHHTEILENIDFADYGACGGYLRYQNCACGKSGNVNYQLYCNYIFTDETYIDENGVLHEVFARVCENCGLRYQEENYSIMDYDNCRQIIYCNISVNIGAQLITAISYETSFEQHQYEVTGVLDEGATSCEDGITITYTCHCGVSYSYRQSNHELLEKERYELSDPAYGACVHQTNVIVFQCLCGAMSDIAYGDQFCEWGGYGIGCWIEGAITGQVYTANNPWGYNLGHSAVVDICAVTDPQCGYAIRRATYYLPVEGQCFAEQWETWQFGYNPETDTYAYEISVKTGRTSTYHAYEEASLDEFHSNGNFKTSGYRYDCPDCGSYYYTKHSYSENGMCTAYECKAENKLDDGQRKLYWEIREYDPINGNITLEKNIYIEADGTETWNQTEHLINNEYTVTINGVVYKGYEEKNIHTNSYGEMWGNEYAYINYKNHSYDIYNYNLELDGNWHRYDYSYNFDGTCLRTTVHTSSYGEYNEYTDECHQIYWETILEPTCTQVGYSSNRCVVCESIVGDASEFGPYGHSWEYLSENLYCCGRCGLENSNGADGDIIFEDLSMKYGNGENYVAGYYNGNGVQFFYNVSLWLHEPPENGDYQILLPDIEVFELDGVNALAFSKSAVAEAALAMGYTPDMYDVRLSFVPMGGDEIHDYAITFTEPQIFEASSSDTIGFDIKSNEEVYINITPEISGIWTMYSICDFDSVGILYDSNGKQLIFEDYGGEYGNFRIAWDLVAGETYTLVVRSYGKFDFSGTMPVEINIFRPGDADVYYEIKDHTFVSENNFNEYGSYLYQIEFWSGQLIENDCWYSFSYVIEGDQIIITSDAEIAAATLVYQDGVIIVTLQDGSTVTLTRW